MKAYKNAILLAGTKDSAFVIGTLLINLKDKMDEFIDIFYIIHDGFSENDKSLMQKIANENKQIPCKFVLFTRDDFLQNVAKFNLNFKNIENNFLKRWTHMAFGRFEALKFLDECENILYLDFDVLLLKSVDELFRLKNQSFALAARRGKNILYENFKDENCEFRENKIWRTPIILFNDNIKNSLKYYDLVYKFAIFDNNLIDDQSVFSLFCFFTKLKIKSLEDKFEGQVCLKTSLNSSIIHAYGSNQRFWNNAICNRTWPTWQDYYEKWLKMGGSAYEKGFMANTTYSIQRVRSHLCYKFGTILIKAYKEPKFLVLAPFSLLKIYLKHKTQNKAYNKFIRQNPSLKMPPLEKYDDYAAAVAEKQTFSYRLGKSFLEIFKSFKGFFNFLEDAKKLKKEYLQNL